jgi:pilus assembly protein Flp/PilA
MNKFTAFLRDESGASAAEYVLILTIIGTTLAVGVAALGNAIGKALTDAGTEIGKYSFAKPAA